MSFKAYLDNIEAKTGKSPTDFRKLAEQKGFTVRGTIPKEVKAGQIVAWIKQDFDLGHGHAMAIVALLKGHRDSGSPKVAKPAAKKKQGGRS